MRSRTYRYLPLALCLALTGCGPAEEPAASNTASADAPAAAVAQQRPVPEVDIARIQADAEALAADDMQGRDTGSEAYDRAAAFVAAAMAEAGLVPAGVDGYMQPVPYLQRQLDETSTEVIVHRQGGDQRLSYRSDYLMGGDVVRNRTRVRAPLVFAGYGVHAPELGVDDFAGVDVEGAIVVILSGAPPSFPSELRAYYASGRTKDEAIASRGAVGVISIPSNVDRARRPWDRSVRYAGRPGMSWLSEAGEASGFFATISGSASLSPDAADALIASTGREPAAFLAAAETGDYATFRFGFDATLARRTEHELVESPNVVGLLPGTDPRLSDQIVVISAHLDHLGVCPADESGDTICNGFYDNAMGTAILLETARTLAAVGTPRPVLFIAVSGEEKGLLGSDYFANHPTVPIDQLIADVNLDMPVMMEPTDEIVAFGGDHTSLGPIAARAVEAVGMRLVPDPIPEEAIFVRTDHYMFVRQGIPAIYLSPTVGEAFGTFLHDNYHQPSDQSDLPVDWPSMGRFARANMAIAMAITDAATPPTWNEGDFFGELFAGD